MPVLDIYADGSYDAKSQSGSWAFVAFDGEVEVHRARDISPGTSNNSLEVLAVIEALAWIATLDQPQSVIVWTDSRHVVEGCQNWRHIWRNNGWKRIDANPRARRRSIPDVTAWQRLDNLLDRYPDVTIAWCKGHSGIAGNDQADLLARLPADTTKRP